MREKSKTLALFGGSFDPPHIGHKKILEQLLLLQEIDEIIVMPTYLSPFKSTHTAPPKMRFAWLQTAFAPYERVKVSDYEINKQENSYTLNTLKYFLKEFKKIFLVIGADNLASLPKWYGYKELQTLVEFIVVTRDGINIDKKYIMLFIDEDISSSSLRELMQEEKLIPSCREAILQYYKENNEQYNKKNSTST